MFDIYAPTTSQDSITLTELELYHLINAYRVSEGLPEVPLSSALSATAGRHAADTVQNIWGTGLTLPDGANLHSWSDAFYYGDHRAPQVMWDAPERLGLDYPSAAFEITTSGPDTVQDALTNWRGSAGHDAVLTNTAPWDALDWLAIGVGVETGSPSLPFQGRIYHVWFGASADPGGPPLIEGSAGQDDITGTNFADSIAAGAGHDMVAGADGDDTLAGGAGNDTLFGGNGSDTAVLNLPFASVSATQIAGGYRITSAEGVDDLTGIEQVLFSDGIVAAAALTAGAAGEMLTGTSDPDSLTGSPANDTILGLAGSDTLTGLEGQDEIIGGIGFDSLLGGAGFDTLIGNDGYDTLRGGTGNDSLIGNNGFDLLDGGAGNDTLLGGLGTDTLTGLGGDDLLSGQQGFDSLQGGAGNDTLNGNAGADTMQGSDGNDQLNGGINNDSLLGGDGADTLNGGNGADYLAGNEGDDRLEGNAGADTLNGQGGDDVLRGGIGADTFVYGRLFEDPSHDRIADFQRGIDRVEIGITAFDEFDPDLADYASLNADGFVVLELHGGAGSLTFTGITALSQIEADVLIF